MAADIDALNYPYIRIRDVDWLKRTLLLFPHVVRMVPTWGGPPDNDEVKRFCELEGRRGPLLRSANLDSQNVHQAQQDLIETIKSELDADLAGFTARFGEQAVAGTTKGAGTTDLWVDRLTDRSFQLHESKTTSELMTMLLDAKLAWHPREPHSPGYVEMSPQLGRAVMATLAYACAEDEGLTLVTEFPNLFGRLIHQPRERIFEACLGDEDGPPRDSAAELAEIVVYQRCDPAMLTPERIQSLNHEWEALASFKAALESAARSLPEIIHDEERRADRLNALIDDVFQKWERDRINLSKYTRALFGDGVLDQPEQLLGKVAELALGPATAGAFVGGLTKPSLVGAAAGFAIGVAFHAGRTFRTMRKTEKQSPLRYLTMLEENGVGFIVSR